MHRQLHFRELGLLGFDGPANGSGERFNQVAAQHGLQEAVQGAVRRGRHHAAVLVLHWRTDGVVVVALGGLDLLGHRKAAQDHGSGVASRAVGVVGAEVRRQALQHQMEQRIGGHVLLWFK